MAGCLQNVLNSETPYGNFLSFYNYFLSLSLFLSENHLPDAQAGPQLYPGHTSNAQPFPVLEPTVRVDVSYRAFPSLGRCPCAGVFWLRRAGDGKFHQHADPNRLWSFGVAPGGWGAENFTGTGLRFFSRQGTATWEIRSILDANCESIANTADITCAKLPGMIAPMTANGKILTGCAGLVLLGFLLFVYAYFLPAYAGYSGAGMSGLPAAFMIIAALVLMGAGLVIASGLLVFLLFSKFIFPAK